MNNFQTKGDKAIWEMIYNYVVDLPIGTLVTLDDLSEVINEDFNNQRSSIYKTMKVLQKEKQRMLISVRGKGYRVVEGNDHLRHAEFRHEKAEKQIKLANFEALHINTKEMTSEEKSRWSAFLAWNGQALSVLSSNAEKVAKANVVAKVATDTVMSELDKLRKQIDSYTSQVEAMKPQVEE